MAGLHFNVANAKSLGPSWLDNISLVFAKRRAHHTQLNIETRGQEPTFLSLCKSHPD